MRRRRARAPSETDIIFFYFKDTRRKLWLVQSIFANVRINEEITFQFNNTN